MIPNGKQINWNGHHLVFESEQDSCRGCFFADKDECPECDEGLWIENNPSPWHTGTPTENGDYFVQYNHLTYDVLTFRGKWENLPYNETVVAWQKATPFEVGSGPLYGYGNGMNDEYDQRYTRAVMDIDDLSWGCDIEKKDERIKKEGDSYFFYRGDKVKINLTLVFGKGNEPKTIAKFKKKMPQMLSYTNNMGQNIEASTKGRKK